MPTSSKPLRVALIHDWLHTNRGGEKVLESLLEIYPQAEIFTLFFTPGQLGKTIESKKIHTSILQRFPRIEKYYRVLLPFFPWLVERFSLSGFDLIISSSHCVAKGVIPPPDALHLCYCHTPMRYVWDKYHDYFGHKAYEPFLTPWIHRLRNWDTLSSHRVDHFIANSSWVSKRIKKYYRRESSIAHPPVDTDYFKPISGDKGDFYLVASAFAPYKRIDLALKACEKLGRKLIVIGAGQDAPRLNQVAGKNVTFLGHLSKESLRDYYASARALLFPGEEDFGITPVECMASGTPVIAYGRGGARDSIIDRKTGLFFSEQTVDSLVQAIVEFESIESSFSKAQCQAQASLFSAAKFKTKLELIFDHHLQLKESHENVPLSQRPSSPLD